MRRRSFILPLILVFTPSTAFAHDVPNGGESPPPNNNQFDQIKRDIDYRCHSLPPAEEESLHCFIEAVHQMKEQNKISDEIFSRLIKDGELRLAFRRGFLEGIAVGGECRPPKPRPQPSPVPSPSPTPSPEEGEKVALCHKPSGSSAKQHTIKVSASAVDAHLAHGDTLGECVKSGGSDSKDPGKKKPKKAKGKSNKS